MPRLGRTHLLKKTPRNARAQARADKKAGADAWAALRTDTGSWPDRTIPEPFPEPPRPQSLLDMATSDQRKQYPVTTGFMDYFPDAMVEAARVSFLGNEKHNPGEPLHWSRGKSNDHADCIARHLMQRGGFDTIVVNGKPEKVRHSAALFWRAGALLQQELEDELALKMGRGSR